MSVWTFSWLLPNKPHMTQNDRDRAWHSASWPHGARWAPHGPGAALIPLAVTGGIHMDGFMDTVDARASWQPAEKRLEILKDSHTGAFAVMACAGYLLLSAALYSEADAAAGLRLVGVFILSRALSAWALAILKGARQDGMLDHCFHCFTIYLP